MNRVNKILCDMELPISTAAAEIWPDATITFCFFHFRQALMKNHKRFLPPTFTQEYYASYRQEVDMMSYLAAYPDAVIPTLFAEISRLDLTESGRRFAVQYFGPNYVFGENGNGLPR